MKFYFDTCCLISFRGMGRQVVLSPTYTLRGVKLVKLAADWDPTNTNMKLIPSCRIHHSKGKPGARHAQKVSERS